MIGYDEVVVCGSVLRAHGVGGEVVVPVSGILLESLSTPFLVLEIDGILVPFFIESFRDRSDTSSLVKFEGVNTLEEAEELRGHRVWIPKRYVDISEEKDFTPEMMVGLKVSDLKSGDLGIVEAIDDSTPNTLLLVRGAEDRERILPASLVRNVDFQKGVISFALPEGFLDI